ncbi:MAG: ASKHA domain-containing protein [Treponema sp.]|jgi:uncharacterized 2Fe-2S/4Fe-4S cluster protein (DUF4445 family)|nr:ASKHA domain-containing protein [Treponema sp.]
MAESVFITFITVDEEKKVIQAEKGIKIIEAARKAGLKIETPCNGAGSCGKCGVEIAGSGEFVLACQTSVEKDAAFITRDYESENKSLRILSRGSAFEYELKPFISKKYLEGKTEIYGGKELLGIEEGDTSAFLYGLAVDIGTTTIVASLVNIQNGKTLSVESALNPQSNYAQDVLGRIYFAGKGEGLTVLYRAFINILNDMIASLTKKTGTDSRNIYEVVYSGNTTMLHLACNIEPSSLGRYPYICQTTGDCHVRENNLNISALAIIYLPPVISAYVGADITSGILAVNLTEKRGVSLFIDIGTNGEMVLAKDGVIAASSTAAGPAFEGMNISCGMRASAGAIESFSIKKDGSCLFRTIGGGTSSEATRGTSGEARGICGSGLLDIAGELVRRGIIDKRGRLVRNESSGAETSISLPKKITEKIKPLEGKNAFFITDTVYLSQKDIRQIQLAKSAIRCGIEMLLLHFGHSAADVERVIIAGSFGYHLNEKSLVNIGLLPSSFLGKISFAGNTSLSGAAAFLLNRSFREQMKEVTVKVDKVELAQDAEFERTFIKYMGF